MNNLSGVNCYNDCDACGEGVDRCPQMCIDDCADCLCCACDALWTPMYKDFVCNMAVEAHDATEDFCSPAEPYRKEKPIDCVYEWYCDNHESVSWCRWDCDLRASEELVAGTCYGHGLDGCCYQCFTGCH